MSSPGIGDASSSEPCSIPSNVQFTMSAIGFFVARACLRESGSNEIAST